MSNRQLKFDKHFVSCPEEENDELYPVGIFVFNITHLLACLQSDESRISISEAKVSDFPRYNDGFDQDDVFDTNISDINTIYRQRLYNTYRDKHNDTVTIRLISARHATKHEIAKYQG